MNFQDFIQSSDIVFYDTSSLERMTKEVFFKKPFIISSESMIRIKNPEVKELLNKNPSQFMIIVNGRKKWYTTLRNKVLKDARHSNDNIFVDSVVFVTEDEKQASKARKYFGDLNIKTISDIEEE